MSIVASRPPRPELQDVWIGLDFVGPADRGVILIVDTDRANRAAEASEATLTAEARRSALLAAAGLVAGLAGTWLVDLVTAGPGLRVMVGF